MNTGEQKHIIGYRVARNTKQTKKNKNGTEEVLPMYKFPHRSDQPFHGFGGTMEEHLCGSYRYVHPIFHQRYTRMNNDQPQQNYHLHHAPKFEIPNPNGTNEFLGDQVTSRKCYVIYLH